MLHLMRHEVLYCVFCCRLPMQTGRERNNPGNTTGLQP